LTCKECHLVTKAPTRLAPQVLGDFYSTFQRPKVKPIGTWYKLTVGAYSELPIWSNNVTVIDVPPMARQRKRRRSEVD